METFHNIIQEAIKSAHTDTVRQQSIINYGEVDMKLRRRVRVEHALSKYLKCELNPYN